MSVIYESITLDLDKITDEYMRRISARTDELMDEKLASIGYVKVVRCRDCAYMERQTTYDGSMSWFLCSHFKRPTRCDGFCAWGERK